jgi:hypothetical protein
VWVFPRQFFGVALFEKRKMLSLLIIFFAFDRIACENQHFKAHNCKIQGKNVIKVGHSIMFRGAKHGLRVKQEGVVFQVRRNFMHNIVHYAKKIHHF